MKKQLEGVKVIDCSTYASAPLTARILADWGADVIHIEAPTGDPGRRGNLYSEAYDFEFYNINKKGIVLNMKEPKGMEVLDKLLESADVFVTNFRTKALFKLGIDYESMHKKHPHVVWAQITGYGDEGPEADVPGFDVVAYWARTGQIVDFVEPGESILNAPIGYGDSITGSMLAGGVMAALFNRTRTGVGERVSTSLYGMGCYAMYYTIATAYAGATYPVSRKEPAAIPLKNGFKCSDGEWIYVSILDHERDYPKLCQMLGREDLIGDERFNTLAPAQKNCHALTDVLDAEFIKRDHNEWLKLFLEYGLPCSALPHTGDIYKDPQCQANHLVEGYKTRKGLTFMLPNTPIRFGDNLPAESKNAPRFGGEDTIEVLQSIGYSDGDIAGLEEAGVVAALHKADPDETAV